MKVRLAGAVKRTTVQAGDIIIYNEKSSLPGQALIITNNTVNGCGGLVGVSMDGNMFSSDPNKSVKDGTADLYPKEKYEFVLKEI
jgi:hypothetical protein